MSDYHGEFFLKTAEHKFQQKSPETYVDLTQTDSDGDKVTKVRRYFVNPTPTAGVYMCITCSWR